MDILEIVQKIKRTRMQVIVLESEIKSNGFGV